jgi:HK97 family phage major capsid protein
MNLKDLYAKRAKVHEEMQALKNLAVEEKRDSLTKEESDKFDLFDKDFEDLTRTIKQQELLEARELELAAKQGEPIDDPLKKLGSDDAKENEERYADTFRQYCRVGMADLSNEQRTILKAGFTSDEQRQQSTTDSAGGYMIPQGFSNGA